MEDLMLVFFLFFFYIIIILITVVCFPLDFLSHFLVDSNEIFRKDVFY